MDVTHQIGVFLCLTEGLLDDIDLDEISKAQTIITTVVADDESFKENIMANEKLKPEVKKSFLEEAKKALEQVN